MSTEVRRSGLKKRLIILALAGSLLAGLAWYLKNHVSLDELIEHELRLRETIEDRPWHSFATGLAIYALVSLIPGTSGKSVIFGWLFGFWQGVAIIILGLTTAATVNFYLSRYIFRDWIEQRYEKFLLALNQHLAKEGAFYLLTLRMAHFPFSIINLASGASRVRVQTFCWTTALGLLPGTAVFAWVGVRLPSLDRLASHGAKSLLDPLLFAALAASAIFPIVFRWSIRKLGILKDTESADHLPEN